MSLIENLSSLISEKLETVAAAKIGAINAVLQEKETEIIKADDTVKENVAAINAKHAESMKADNEAFQAAFRVAKNELQRSVYGPDFSPDELAEGQFGDLWDSLIDAQGSIIDSAKANHAKYQDELVNDHGDRGSIGDSTAALFKTSAPYGHFDSAIYSINSQIAQIGASIAGYETAKTAASDAETAAINSWASTRAGLVEDKDEATTEIDAIEAGLLAGTTTNEQALALPGLKADKDSAEAAIADGDSNRAVEAAAWAEYDGAIEALLVAHNKAKDGMDAQKASIVAEAAAIRNTMNAELDRLATKIDTLASAINSAESSISDVDATYDPQLATLAAAQKAASEAYAAAYAADPNSQDTFDKLAVLRDADYAHANKIDEHKDAKFVFELEVQEKASDKKMAESDEADAEAGVAAINGWAATYGVNLDA